jgi:hypothetical protein
VKMNLFLLLMLASTRMGIKMFIRMGIRLQMQLVVKVRIGSLFLAKESLAGCKRVKI